jgi:protein arginine kinase activator
VKCDHCQNEATVQETIIQGGKVLQRHLCEQCAKSFGVKVGGTNKLAQALTQAVMAQALGGLAAKEQIRAAAAATCSTCGLAYNQFRQTGMLGCPDCYTCFEPQLGPLLERAHEGATHHVGKAPRRTATESARPISERAGALFGTPEERSKRLIILRKQLAESIAAEQYERAAQLRDEMRRLGTTKDEPKDKGDC